MMQRLFGLILFILCAASIGVYRAAPDLQSDVPVLYWVTDWYPERHDQVQQFKQWLIRNGHVTADGKPVMELRIDASNRDVTKLMIQGASGVCADLLDLSEGQGLRYIQAAGMLDDLTVDAQASGFDPTHTYRVLETEICVDGRQYAFPRQAYAFMYVVNVDTFQKYGLGKPPVRWTVEEFESIGKQFTAAANPAGRPRSVFFANEVRALTLWRSFGACEMNETLTASALDRPGYIRALKLLRKWSEDDHIIPTATDLKSIANQADTQFGDSRMQMFADGRYAMIGAGRHALPLLRRFGHFRIAAAEPPHGGFPNTWAGAGVVGIYTGSAHKDLARLFLEYVATEEFSEGLIRNGDGLPPNPRSTTQPSYLQPPEHPNEWGSHEEFAKAMHEIGIGGAYSPFVLPMRVYEIEQHARDGYLSGLWSAEDATARVVQQVNAEIQRTVASSDQHLARYDEAMQLQRQIEAYRRQGKRVPLAWIANPFYRAYYQHMGFAE